MDKQGIPHHVLNAKHHAQEAEIVAQAGRLHAITVATNMAGRGVDIVLGGNPEGLARDEVRAQGLDLDSDEGRERYQSLLGKFKQQCAAEADEVRALGGLYVLGSERHESRRIDNQLRGRSGRQGDPGESRFYLSLEDELMRLFATGAVSWVMGRALPDDVPIEARMVTKAIERAQHTVEGRNAETRKELLKYDEVRNEQRKVIYQRRLQIIDGEDLKPHTEALLTATVDRVVANHCPNDFPEEWDLEGLVVELTQYYPTRFTVEDLEAATSVVQLTESILTEALEFYDEREQTFPGGSRDRAGDRAQRADPDHRPALARAPRGDGLPERGHPPPWHRADRPARGLAARGIRDVRQAHGLHRRRLPALCHARPGPCRRRPRTPTTPRRRSWPQTTRLPASASLPRFRPASSPPARLNCRRLAFRRRRHPPPAPRSQQPPLRRSRAPARPAAHLSAARRTGVATAAAGQVSGVRLPARSRRPGPGSSPARRPRSGATSRAGAAAAASSRSATARAETIVARASDAGPDRRAP